ncbi:MAG: hypothetical protein AB1646_14555 [Thermodesulfobacteriota bacterium]
MGFKNGESRVFDMKSYPETGVFVRLPNVASFRAARVAAGSAEWPGEVDLSYDTRYLENRPIPGRSGMNVAFKASFSRDLKGERGNRLHREVMNVEVCQ